MIDSSDETRDREEANLEQVLVGSRIALAALSHEIRNICAAISNVQQNLLQNTPDERQGQEFEALRQLVEALERMASVELSLIKRQTTPLNLPIFLGDLYVVLNATLREAGIELAWETEPGLPPVWADSSSLIQVFLNLTRNAEAALAGTVSPRLRLRAARDSETVHIEVSDNGPGVARPDKLFRPFGGRGAASGLGLYLSRAMLRSFHGNLRHESSATGATFVVDLNVAEVDE
jgi:two-component system sensor kinase FixL